MRRLWKLPAGAAVCSAALPSPTIVASGPVCCAVLPVAFAELACLASAASCGSTAAACAVAVAVPVSSALPEVVWPVVAASAMAALASSRALPFSLPASQATSIPSGSNHALNER